MTWSMAHRPSKSWYNGPPTREKAEKKPGKSQEKAT